MDHTSGRPVRGWGLARSRPARLICATFLCCTVFSFTSAAAQRLDGSGETLVPSIAPDDRPEPPGRVEVQPVAQDDEIRQRIANILKTTGWFREPKVTVQEGIVFLKGTTGNDESKQWAGDLAKVTVHGKKLILEDLRGLGQAIAIYGERLYKSLCWMPRA
jgi:small conductance mechanosensitive channel